MIESSSDRASLVPTSRPLLPALLLLFIGSGCAALIYEVVWLQLLQLIVGSSAVSLGVLLGTFMGGMCLGSLLLSKVVSPSAHPLRVYAMLELGIGAIGVLELFGIPYVDHFYSANVGHGAFAIFMRCVAAAICLLPPTLLMGATLPAIARWVQTTPAGVSWLGFFYGGNIAGAVFGCLLAGFYLLRLHNMAVATYVAAAINATVAMIAALLSAVVAHEPPPAAMRDQRSDDAPGSLIVLFTIALSGMSALGAEVVWTRLLSLTFGQTVYTFSIILAVFLVGLGIGSSLGAALARSIRHPMMALGVCQLLLAGAIALSASAITQSVPFWPIDPSISWSPWIDFQMDLMRALLAVLAPTLLWGASFPLALAAIATPGKDAGTVVGRVYAANTVGAIVGALLFSMVFVGWKGTQFSQQALIVIAAIAALIIFVGGFRSPRPNVVLVNGVLAVLAIVPTILLVGHVRRAPDELLLWGRYSAGGMAGAKPLYIGEGRTSTVAVSEISGSRNFHVAGKIEASSLPRDMRLQRMLGHFPALFHSNPKSVLVVGCGAGVTAGSFVSHPEVKRIVICEIEPLIPHNVSDQYFGKENHHVVQDPRVEIVFDDARHYILTTNEKFDIITSDPIHPWVKGAATLYTREYFELCKKKLNPGGIVGQWVPLYESKPEVVKSEVATFMEAFPDGTIWSNDDNGNGYDVILLGEEQPMKIDLDELQERLDRPDHKDLRESLQDVGFNSAIEICGTYGGRGPDLGPWMADAQINRDLNLRLQYLAGLGLNSKLEVRIYQDMLALRRYPQEIFSGSERRQEAVRSALTPRVTTDAQLTK